MSIVILWPALRYLGGSSMTTSLSGRGLKREPGNHSGCPNDFWILRFLSSIVRCAKRSTVTLNLEPINYDRVWLLVIV